MLRPLLVSMLYAIGVLSTVFHFSNGLWTQGITWGLWTSPAAMRRANWVSILVGVLLGAAGLGSVVGMRSVDGDQARATESRMEDVKRLLEGGQQPPAVRATEPVDSAEEALLPASDSRVTAPTGT